MAFAPRKQATKDDFKVVDRPTDIKSVFKPATDLAKITSLKLGLFGKAKVGKTHFCLTAKQPVFIIDTEGSVRVNIQQFPEKIREGIFVSEVIQFADKQEKKIDLVKSLDALVDAIDILTNMIEESKETGKRGTVIIDSATDIWDWLGIWLDEAASVKTTKSGDMPRFEWGKANRKYAELMYMLLHCGWNVVMTFRAAEAISQKGESLGYDRPRWQKNTDYWLDLICEMKREPGTRALIFRGGRYGDNIPTIIDPTWDKLLAHLEKNCGVSFE